METLTLGEKTVLRWIYRFAKDHSFKYGINRKCLPSSLSDCIQSLFDKRLVFFKRKYSNTYWLPTEDGRALVEANHLVVLIDEHPET